MSLSYSLNFMNKLGNVYNKSDTETRNTISCSKLFLQRNLSHLLAKGRIVRNRINTLLVVNIIL